MDSSPGMLSDLLAPVHCHISTTAEQRVSLQQTLAEVSVTLASDQEACSEEGDFWKKDEVKGRLSA